MPSRTINKLSEFTLPEDSGEVPRVLLHRRLSSSDRFCECRQSRIDPLLPARIRRALLEPNPRTVIPLACEGSRFSESLVSRVLVALFLIEAGELEMNAPVFVSRQPLLVLRDSGWNPAGLRVYLLQADLRNRMRAADR